MLSARGSSKGWVASPNPNPKAQLRLFCFPYAGGGASIFYRWARELPGKVEVCPIQLPGRENRMNEKPFTRLGPMVQDLTKSIWSHLDKPFVFFGHSMGAMISFELAMQLRALNGPAPLGLFVSASRAPHIPDHSPAHALPEHALLERLRTLNGTDQVVLDHPEWLRLYLPLLRADLELDETYHCPPAVPLQCPIVAFGGLEDKEVTYQELEAWRIATSGRFSLRMFPGDHFFLRSAESLLLRAIALELEQMPFKAKEPVPEAAKPIRI